MDKERFEKNMAVFSFHQHQDFLTYFKEVKKYSYTFEDIEKYITVKIKEKEEEIGKARNKITKICPVCQSHMILLSVNINAATITGDDSKSMWLCINSNCQETIYNKKDIRTLMREAMPQGGK